MNSRGLVVWGTTIGVCGTKNEQVDEAESESSIEEFVKIDEASVTENGEVEDRVGLELELFLRGICVDLGCMEPVCL